MKNNPSRRKSMRTKALMIATLAAASMAVQAAGDKPTNGIDAPAAFARLKSLAGEWQADTPMGKARLTYEVIAGGTSLVERESAENMPAMMTVYHLDGGRLLMTHYCMAGNQPRMQARAFDAKTGEVRFQFLDATNLSTPEAGHMRNLTLRIGDHDHFGADWDFYEGGQRKNTETFQYTRVR
jgi:hypothetical protein